MAQGRKVADRDREIASNKEIAFVEGGIESLKTTLKFYMNKWKKGFRNGKLERIINFLEDAMVEDMVLNHIQFCITCPEKPANNKNNWRAAFDQAMRVRMAESYERVWNKHAETFAVLLDPDAKTDQVLPMLVKYFEFQQKQYLKLKNYNEGGGAQKAKLLAAFLKKRPEILTDLEQDMDEHGWRKERLDEKIERLFFHLDREAALSYAKGMGLLELWEINDEKKFAKTAEKHLELYINAKKYERTESRRMQLILQMKPELQKALLEELKNAHASKTVDFGGDTDVAAHWINRLFETTYEKLYQSHEAEYVDIIENRYSEEEWLMLIGGFFARRGWDRQFDILIRSYSGEMEFDEEEQTDEDLEALNQVVDEDQDEEIDTGAEYDMEDQGVGFETEIVEEDPDIDPNQNSKKFDNKAMFGSTIFFFKDCKSKGVNTGEVLSEVNMALTAVVEEFQDREKVLIEMERYGFDPEKRSEWIERFLLRGSIKVKDQLNAYKLELFGGKHADDMLSMDAINAAQDDESDGLSQKERMSLVSNDDYKSTIVSLKAAYTAMVQAKPLIQNILHSASNKKKTSYGAMQFIYCLWLYPYKGDGIPGIVKGYTAQRTNYPPQLWNDYHAKELANMRVDMSEQLDDMMTKCGFQDMLEIEDYVYLDKKLGIWDQENNEQLLIIPAYETEKGYRIIEPTGYEAMDDSSAEYHRLYGDVMKQADSISKDVRYRKGAIGWDWEGMVATLEEEMKNSLAEVIDDGK